MNLKTRRRSVRKNEFDAILEFAQDVVPRNWNIYWSWTAERLKRDRHTCNIELKADPYHDDMKDDCVGMLHDLRWFKGFVFTEIYLDTDHYDMEETILHELAHVAEHRYIILREGGFRQDHASICGTIYSHFSSKEDETLPDPVLITVEKYGDHGDLFKRCLNAFHSRASRKGSNLKNYSIWT
jgi:hypothetical protein